MSFPQLLINQEPKEPFVPFSPSPMSLPRFPIRTNFSNLDSDSLNDLVYERRMGMHMKNIDLENEFKHFEQQF